MTLRINATFTHEGVNYYVEADTVAELATNIGLIKGGAATAPAPTPETGKGKKSASTEKSAATSPPADSTKADSAASAPTPASPSPAPAAEPVVDYTKSGLPEKIAGYLGDKESGGYAERRAVLVKLLADFKVKTAKELKAEQFKDFGAKMDELAKPADEDLG